MPKYYYKARDALGKQVQGIFEAVDEKAVAERLALSGHFVSLIQSHKEARGPGALSRFRGVGRKQLIMFSRQLATIIKAGMPLLSGLDILIEQTDHPFFKAVLREIRMDLNGGASFTQALARHPKAFSKLYVSTVRVGEETGGLEEVLNSLADFIEWEDSLRSAILSSLLYPVVVFCVAISVGIFLLVYVLPKFHDVYMQADVPLPGPTRFLFFISNVVTEYWYVFLCVIAGAIVCYLLYKRTSSGRYNIDRFKLGLPVIKGFISKIAAVRFARSLEIMARSGVPVISALEIIRETMTNEVFARAVADISVELQAGRTVGSALGDHPEFEPMLVQMVAVGEETGQLDEMLGFVGDAYEAQIEYMSRNLPKVIEPVLLIFLAGMVAILALSLFLPIFKMIEVVKRL